MNKNLNQLINILKEYEVQGIYLNDELSDFHEFLDEYESMNIEKVLEENEQTFYILMTNGGWLKVSTQSLEEVEELELL